MLTSDTGICIRAVDYSETSQVLTFFTRDHGKLGVIAKGSKRPKSAFGGPIEMFAHGQLTFTANADRALATLTGFEIEANRTNPASVSADLYVLHGCLLGVELLDHMTDEHDPHPDLYEAFVAFVADMCESAAKPSRRDTLALLILFELQLLMAVGLRPVLDRCANCRTAVGRDVRGYYFSSAANGLICRDCESSFHDKVALSTPVAACLTRLATIAQAPLRTLRDLEKVLLGHFAGLMHRAPRMAKYVLRVCPSS
ncbi:MAG TPA: DNA repair protein RecO [Phycisphaerales bacterium]|nr:DNA repair protein RecO [Phycisphaerales bacterium]